MTSGFFLIWLPAPRIILELSPAAGSVKVSAPLLSWICSIERDPVWSIRENDGLGIVAQAFFLPVHSPFDRPVHQFLEASRFPDDPSGIRSCDPGKILIGDFKAAVKEVFGGYDIQ